MKAYKTRTKVKGRVLVVELHEEFKDVEVITSKIKGYQPSKKDENSHSAL